MRLDKVNLPVQIVASVFVVVKERDTAIEQSNLSHFAVRAISCLKSLQQRGPPVQRLEQTYHA